MQKSYGLENIEGFMTTNSSMNKYILISGKRKRGLALTWRFLFSTLLIMALASNAASNEHLDGSNMSQSMANSSICGSDLKIVRDGFGEEVSLCTPINRIVSPWCTNNELLKVLDASDKIVAVDSSMTGVSTGLFPELKDLPDCGGWNEPDFETILSLRPDLYIPWLVTTASEEDRYGITRKRLLEERLPGIPILCLDNNEYRGADYFLDEVRMLGEILDKRAQSDDFIEFYENCTAPITKGIEGLSEDEKPRVWITSLFFTGNKVTGSPYAYTGFAPIDLAGGENIASGLGGYGKKVDLEWIVEENPEYIFIQIWAAGNKKSPYDSDYPLSIAKEQVEEILKMPQLAQVDAVKNKRVYVIQYSHFTKGPSRAIATAYLAKLLHPDLFVSLDPIKMHQEYVDRFLKINFNVTENGANFIYPYPEVS
jgi:iron complex transport system substrate-binding protein